jgi:hypothetical protein
MRDGSIISERDEEGGGEKRSGGGHRSAEEQTRGGNEGRGDRRRSGTRTVTTQEVAYCPRPSGENLSGQKTNVEQQGSDLEIFLQNQAQKMQKMSEVKHSRPDPRMFFSAPFILLPARERGPCTAHRTGRARRHNCRSRRSSSYIRSCCAPCTPCSASCHGPPG